MKPILFNTEMVRAILAGRKTVTRRVVKGYIPENAAFGHTIFTPKGHISCWGVFSDGYGEKFYRLPYCPGDVLYVRETWSKYEDGYYLYRAWPGPGNEPEEEDKALKALGLKWFPSIHMPREAARLFLRVTDARVERLKDMTTSDAFDEGFTDWNDVVRAWDSTVKPADREKYGWAENPWCWVIEFERVSKEASEAMEAEAG